MFITVLYQPEPYVKGPTNQIQSESAFITDYLAREIRSKIKLGCGRLNLSYTDGGYPECTTIRFYGVVEMRMNIPFDKSYFSMTDIEKMNYICFLVENGMKEYCSIKGIDYLPVQEALDKLREQNFFVGFNLLKPCRRGDYVAKLYCIHTMEQTNFFVDIYRKRTFIKRIPFFQSHPEYMVFNLHLGVFEWLDDETVCLHHKSHSIYGDSRDKVLKLQL